MKIWAWGANTNAQCGLGYCSEQVSTPTLVPVHFKCPKNPNKSRTFAEYPDILPLKVAGGASETVLLVENIPFTEPFEWKPNFVILPYPKMRDISCGWDFSLYLSNEGNLHSRGSNSHCQLGRLLPEGSKSDKQWDRNKFPEDPTDQSVGLDLAQVAAGLRHGAVISSHLELLVWGNNSQNQIGPSTRPGPDEPISQRIIPSPREATVLDFPAGFHTGFTQVACGKDFTIACDQEGWLYGCGLNKFGCLCHAPQDVKGFQGFASIYEKIPNRSFPGNIADLKCGWGHCLALLDTGKVVTWGRNDFGQLGRDSCNPKFDVEPKPIVLPESIVSIACGSEHSLALGESGAVYAWGWNEHDNCGVPNRQFGNVTTDSIRYPIRVPFPEPVKAEVIGCGAAPRKMPIIFDEAGMVEQVKLNPVTTIGKEVCASHVVKVWEAISAFIVQTLCGGRAVRIPGLLTVTFKIIQIELSQRDTILQKNPHIILSSEMALRHSLRVKKPPYNLDIPEVDLNLSVIAKICNMSRVHVEHCVEEVIHAFNRAIACDPHVELWLTKIGRVIVDCADVEIVFCSEFLNLLGYSEEFIQDKRCPVR